MKTTKILIVALMLLPLFAGAQTKSNRTSTQTEQIAAKYPLYNDSEAAVLWGNWKKNIPFSQESYGRVIDLCDASFYYLSTELQDIISQTSSASMRKKKAVDLDVGITSNMSNFARTFAVRMQNLAAQGALSNENVAKVVAMLEKKKVYMQLNQEVYHPN